MQPGGGLPALRPISHSGCGVGRDRSPGARSAVSIPQLHAFGKVLPDTDAAEGSV